MVHKIIYPNSTPIWKKNKKISPALSQISITLLLSLRLNLWFEPTKNVLLFFLAERNILKERFLFSLFISFFILLFFSQNVCPPVAFGSLSVQLYSPHTFPDNTCLDTKLLPSRHKHMDVMVAAFLVILILMFFITFLSFPLNSNRLCKKCAFHMPPTITLPFFGQRQMFHLLFYKEAC